VPKPLRIILICAAITGFLLLVWWAFTHRSEVKEGEVNKRQVKQEKAEVEKNKEKEPVTGKRQVKMTRICLSMDVNNSENGQFLHGTPLFLTVYLRNASSMQAAQARALYKQYENKKFSTPEEQKRVLDFLKYEQENIPDERVTLQSALSPPSEWISFQLQTGKEEYQTLGWPVERLQVPEGNQVHLDTRIVTIEYGLSPEAVKSISPGSYTIRARLIPGLSPAIQEGLETAPVTVTILAEEHANPNLIVQRVLLIGEYHLKKGDTAVAERVVRGFLEQEPKSISAWVLLGRIQEKMNKGEEAYHAYQEAVNILAEKNVKEPPRFLMRKINEYFRKFIQESPGKQRD
jgi:tetratricopeptide (TPR) repeat protein